MTLIADLTSRVATAQFSDRLVTKNGRTHDARSNKTVIYSARDALVSISYTGIAYIGEVTTDVFIACSLTELNPSKWGGWKTEFHYKYVDLGRAIRRLCDDLTRAFSAGRADDPLIISVNGWQWKTSDCKRSLRRGRVPSKSMRPVLISICKRSRKREAYILPCIPRNWHRHNVAKLRLLGSLQNSRELHDYIRKSPPTIPVVDSCERIINEMFPLANSLCNSVGKCSISIFIVPGFHDSRISDLHEPFCRIRYFQNGASDVFDYSSNLMFGDLQTVPVFYTPIIIMPGNLMPPLRLNNHGWGGHTGFFKIIIEAPDTPIKESLPLTAMFVPTRPGRTR